jgi:hypothetical protein
MNEYVKNNNVQDKIIDRCILSEEMRNYLKKQELSVFTLTDIIAGSPLYLRKKLELYDLIGDNGYTNSFRQETEKALAELTLDEGDVLCLEEWWYDNDILGEKASFTGPFTTLHAALGYIKESFTDEEWDDGEACWSILEKWVPGNEHGKMDNTYTYYLIKDEVVYFTSDDNINNSFSGFHGYVDSMNLSLPIPFKPGDIVILDSLPFVPIRLAILLEVNNSDCCGVQILYRHGDGLWRTGALKHGAGWKDTWPMLSSLYRLSLYQNELNETDKVLLDIQDYILKKEHNGALLWERINNTRTRWDMPALSTSDLFDMIKD